MAKLFLLAFLLMSVQTFLGILQIKAYQREIRNLKGTGLLGIGFRRGVFEQGEIIILSYDRQSKTIYKCRQLKGRTIFQKFKDVKEYENMPLENIRKIGIIQDSHINKKLRKKEAYCPEKLDKRKGALIQAVEAIDNRLAREDTKTIQIAV